ncbi:hypothetical protein F511_05775 [Dorcoceras hygrometricum]|uniref:Uncharacterized protein n=1 Tax=Dorcoceras hygrometricum TaxID=472368 RepID=A0A2Z7BI17_9LAMI|nr:hypothetical protein F511_05775 [Dorcoceras hygrometricum]
MVSMKNPLAAILDSNRFTGLNYQDWLCNLNLVLASEKLLYTIEKCPPEETPADISPEELITPKQWRDDEVKARCYVMASMSNEIQRRFEKTKTGFLLMNCHGMRESRADAKLIVSLCFAILITVDESVDSRYSRRLLMSNVEQEADTSKRNSEESDVVLKIQQMLFALITSSRKIPAGSYSTSRRELHRWEVKSQAFETNEWTTSCKHIVTTNWTTSCKYIQTQATAHPDESFIVPAVAMHPVARLCTSRKLYASSRKMMYQSRATVDPVASFSAIAYPVDMVSRRKKSRSSEALQPGAKYSVVKVTSRSDEPAAKQLTIYEELSKLDVNC